MKLAQKKFPLSWAAFLHLQVIFKCTVSIVILQRNSGI